MKIEFLNDSLTEARVTRGVLWWKRQAIVQRVEAGFLRSCHHADFFEGNRKRSGLMCTLCHAVFGCLSDPVWQPVSSPPVAKVVRR